MNGMLNLAADCPMDCTVDSLMDYMPDRPVLPLANFMLDWLNIAEVGDTFDHSDTTGRDVAKWSASVDSRC
jgi:hypothetical protein